MTDPTSNEVIQRCRAYWLGSGVDPAITDEMTAELESHLQDATSAGKSVATVTGASIDAFAEEWAEAFRGPKPQQRPSDAVAPHTSTDRTSGGLWTGLIAIVMLVIAVALFAPTDDSMDQGQWVATWFIAAGVLAIGEMVTAGFFLLPFAAGAGVSGILALLTVNIPFQIATFVVISILALWLLQRFARQDIRGDLLPVGAARYIGSSAVVIEPVSRLHSGRVLMGTEDWRATTDGDHEIPPQTEVRVTEVRGARLVVERVS